MCSKSVLTLFFLQCVSDAQYYSTGAIVPRTNDTVISVPLNLAGTVVIPAFEFQQSGKVTHWDFEAVKTGFLTFTVRLDHIQTACFCQRNKMKKM